MWCEGVKSLLKHVSFVVICLGKRGAPFKHLTSVYCLEVVPGQDRSEQLFLDEFIISDTELLLPPSSRAAVPAVWRATFSGRPAQLGPVGLAASAASDAAPVGASAGAGGASTAWDGPERQPRQRPSQRDPQHQRSYYQPQPQRQSQHQPQSKPGPPGVQHTAQCTQLPVSTQQV